MNTDKFCKLFEDERGQVLVILDEDEPKLNIKFRVLDGGAYMSVGLEFKGKDDDAQWKAAEAALNNINSERAFSIRNKAMGDLLGDIR